MRNKITAPLNVDQTMSSFELFSSAIFFITDKVLCKMTLLQVCIFPKVGKGFPEQGPEFDLSHFICKGTLTGNILSVGGRFLIELERTGKGVAGNYLTNIS